MTTLEDGTFAFGAGVLPLSAATTNTLLEDADPALAAVVDFIAWGIDNYVGARLAAEMLRFGLKPPTVGTLLTTDPLPFLLSNQTPFPILALWRMEDTWDQETLSLDRSVSTWSLSYVLPTLSPAGIARIDPVLRAISNTLRRLLHNASDPAYQSGALVLDAAGIQLAKLVKASYGTFEPIVENASSYRTLNCTIVVLERTMPVDGAYPAFTGADVGVDVVADDGTTVSDVADFQAFLPPNITGIDVTSGPATGGTAITITGTDFRVGASVTLDDVACTNVVVSSTRITATTPPHDAYPTFAADLVVTNDDGQNSWVPSAFTFTTT